MKSSFVYIFCMVFLIICIIGCGKHEVISNESFVETESVIYEEVKTESEIHEVVETEPFNETVLQYVEEKAEDSPMVYYDDITFGTLVEDEVMLQQASSLILEGNKLFEELMVFYHIDPDQSVVIDDIPYYLVDIEGCSSWDYYENRALELYTEAYVDEVFTPYYLEEKKLYKEYDGKLYRVMADGFGSRIYEDSIKLWHVYEDIYLVSYLDNIATVVEQVPGVNVRTVRLNNDKKFGFENIIGEDRK